MIPYDACIVSKRHITHVPRALDVTLLAQIITVPRMTHSSTRNKDNLFDSFFEIVIDTFSLYHIVGIIPLKIR